MKQQTIFILILFFALTLFAAAPTVENVTFNQRTDGSLVVDIYYDLSDNDADTKKIVVEASADNGSTWNLVCSSLSGDVGDNVAQGTGKHVVWDFYVDNPNLDGDQFKVRVTALETGTMTDYDGNVYQTVKIGDQWWMAENLRVTHYKNGYAIPLVMDATDWTLLRHDDDGNGVGAYCYYNNDINNVSTYGLLYNWYAVAHSRGLAPDGWHVPTDAEWRTLETTLGGSSVAGSKLAGRVDLWMDGDLENNANFGASGFSALPGGYRLSDDGTFHSSEGYGAYFWSSSSYDNSSAWSRGLSYGYSGVAHITINKRYGFSVRLVRD